MRKKILFVACLLAGLLFLNAGLNKFFNYIPTPDDLPEAQVKMFVALMQVGWLIPLIGAAEIIGGILFVIPRYRALGAIVLFPIIVGILLAHFTIAPEGIPMALIIFAIWIWSVVENWRKYTPMIEKS